jgi:hypothetical protein
VFHDELHSLLRLIIFRFFDFFLLLDTGLPAVQNGQKFTKICERAFLVDFDELYQSHQVLRAAAVPAIDPDDIAVHKRSSFDLDLFADRTKESPTDDSRIFVFIKKVRSG